MVNLLVKVLDKDVALTRLAQGGITLRPHDTAVGDALSISRHIKIEANMITHQARFLMRE